MKTRLVFILVLVIVITGVTITPTLAVPIDKLNIAIISTNTSAWVDDFNSPTLNSRWFWVREDSTHWSLTSSPGNLRITTETGNLWGTGPDTNNLKNILLTNPSMPDFQITTKVSFDPTQNIQFAPLFVYQDDDNYVSMERVYGYGSGVEFNMEQGGVPSFMSFAINEPITYLRINKHGNTYTGLFSSDGVTWNIMGQFNILLSNPEIGLGAGNNDSGLPEIPADFDYFSFIPLPIQATWTDDFSNTTLNSQWSWVREDPTHWSLNTLPGFMRIITQQGGIVGTGADMNNQKNILLTPAPAGDFQITTHVEITPTENFQHAALIIYQDHDNYIEINHAYVFGSSINFDLEVNGTTTSINFAGSANYLRITRQGRQYAGYYSLDGDVWSMLGSYTAQLTKPRVGISAANGATNAADIPADFEFVKLEFNYLIYLPTIVK